jgi:hypothetical protein
MLVKLEDLNTALLRLEAGHHYEVLLVKTMSLPAAGFESRPAKTANIATTIANVRAHDSIGH